MILSADPRFHSAGWKLWKLESPDAIMSRSMNPTYAYKLVDTVRQECRFALAAFARLRSALNEADQDWIFVCAHAVLLHSGQIARFLLPARAASAERGEFLRRELAVPAASPLLAPALRELLDRSDETYEEWVQNLQSPHYVELSVMPQGALAGSSPDVFQRRIDPDSLRFGFRHWTVDLNRLAQELRRLDNACQAWLRGHTIW